MKPLYWKLLLIFGAVLFAASLVIPKALRKNALVGLDKVSHAEFVSDKHIDRFSKHARLSFQEVAKSTPEELQLCVEEVLCPLGARALPEAISGKNGGGYLILRDEVVISNSDIKSAFAGLHPANNQPIVNFTFTDDGNRKFCEFTTSHVGERFAIVINDEIITAPRINGPICGGRGFIENSFTMESAGALALSLNAGTLPTKLRVVEERVVTP